MMVIDKFKDEYFFLSNFSDSDFVYDGLLYHNAEAAFQSAKCIDKSERQKFTELNATQAKKLGRELFLRPDWEDSDGSQRKNSRKRGFLKKV